MKMVIERMKNGDRCWDFLLLPHGFGGFERVKMFFMFLLFSFWDLLPLTA